MNQLYLIVRLAGQRVALPAKHVASVVRIDEIAPVPLAPPHVAGLFALRSRVLTVIDTRIALGLVVPAVAPATTDAVIVDCEGHSYALIVDRVEDVIEGPPPGSCPAVLTAAWARAALGAILVDADLLAVLDPPILIAGCRQRAA